MNIKSVLPGIRSWFDDYIEKYSSDDPAIQENIDLKKEHTIRVCEAILDIGASLDLSHEDLSTAEICALLHDIGRFEQYSEYRTFSDSRSEDHAALGVRAIQEHGILECLDNGNKEVILNAVSYHNKFSLPDKVDDRCLFFLKLLRDADKVDIWRVVTDYYRSAANKRNQAIELDLSDKKDISEPVYRSLIKGDLVRMEDLRTLNDFKLLQIGWIYDIYFHRTFQIIRERRYLEKIRDALPENSDRVSKVYERAVAYLDMNV